jgi:hypothetical protein
LFYTRQVQTINADDPENLRAYTERRKLVARKLKFQGTLSVNLTFVYFFNL